MLLRGGEIMINEYRYALRWFCVTDLTFNTWLHFVLIGLLLRSFMGSFIYLTPRCVATFVLHTILRNLSSEFRPLLLASHDVIYTRS
jgi:hypothetical protein